MHSSTQGLGTPRGSQGQTKHGKAPLFQAPALQPRSRYLCALQQFAVQRRLLVVSQDFTLLGEIGFHFVQFCPKALQLQWMENTGGITNCGL